MSLSYPMLTPTNYPVWAIKVEAILDAQGLWEAVSPEEGAAVDEKKNTRNVALVALVHDHLALLIDPLQCVFVRVASI